MLNQESTKEQIQSAINDLPELSRKVYEAIQGELYGEPGFSDLEWYEVESALPGMERGQIAGCAKKLIGVGLVYVEENDVNGKVYQFVHTLQHDKDF